MQGMSRILVDCRDARPLRRPKHGVRKKSRQGGNLYLVHNETIEPALSPTSGNRLNCGLFQRERDFACNAAKSASPW